MKVLDLFSGIGGFSLGLERAGMTTVAFCEIEPYPRKVLAKHWPTVPIYDDVRELNATRLAADGITGIDLICGGFPCQPFSVGGKQLGAEDDRHLWPEYFRLIQELRPTWVIGENVVGLINLGLDTVLDDLESIGYATRTFDIPACGVGAPHERRRLWIVAHADRNDGRGRDSTKSLECNSWMESWSSGEDVADPSQLHGNGSNDNAGERLEGEPLPESGNGSGQNDVAYTNGAFGERDKCAVRSNQERTDNFIADWWATESGFCRVANGVPARAHRLKALGNAVVPQIPEIIGRAIMQINRSAE